MTSRSQKIFENAIAKFNESNVKRKFEDLKCVQEETKVKKIFLEIEDNVALKQGNSKFVNEKELNNERNNKRKLEDLNCLQEEASKICLGSEKCEDNVEIAIRQGNSKFLDEKELNDEKVDKETPSCSFWEADKVTGSPMKLGCIAAKSL